MMLNKTHSSLKKGFTLIEVLGVIIILSVVALITVPVITKVINDSRKNSFKVSAENLIEAANNYYADNQLIINKTQTFNFASGGKTEDGTELSYSGTKPKQGRLILTIDGSVVLIDVSDGRYYANYDSAGDDAVIVTETNEVLTRDELTERLKKMETDFKKYKETTDAKIATLTTENDSKLDTNKLLNKTYPVGSIYVSVNADNPTSKFGGTWVAYGSGRTLVGVNNSDSDFNTVEKTGGSESVSVTLTNSNLPNHTHYIPSLSGGTNGTGNHNHSGTATDGGNHNHYINNGHNLIGYSGAINSHGTAPGSASHAGLTWIYGATQSGGTHSHNLSINYNGNHSHSLSTNANNTGASGNGSAFSVNKLQPYITVYMWKRTA